MELFIASIVDKHNFRTAYYIAQVPGDGGKDWGWTEDRSKATPLSAYWRERFEANARHLNWSGVSVVLYTPICPECGAVGGHDDNDATKVSELSFCCRECGTHFDAIP